MTKQLGTWIPRYLHLNMIKNKHNMSEIFLVSSIYSYENNGQKFFASNEYISEYLGISPRRARQVITNLVNDGWIKRELQKCNRGSERQLTTTDKTKEAVSIPPKEEDNILLGRLNLTSNNKDNNKIYNKDLTTTSTTVVDGFIADEAIKVIISKEISSHSYREIDKNHSVFKYYEAAHRWSFDRSNVSIPRNPNTTIIEALLSEDCVTGGSVSDFIYFLDGRWQERHISKRDCSVNLSWLILSQCEDNIM